MGMEWIDKGKLFLTGVYFVVLNADRRQMTKKVVILR
jgi:hypothetical protein